MSHVIPPNPWQADVGAGGRDMGYVTCRLRFCFDARGSLTVCSATLTSTTLP